MFVLKLFRTIDYERDYTWERIMVRMKKYTVGSNYREGVDLELVHKFFEASCTS